MRSGPQNFFLLRAAGRHVMLFERFLLVLDHVKVVFPDRAEDVDVDHFRSSPTGSR